MSRFYRKLTIAHLWPDAAGISGDSGNILAFEKRCNWRDIDTDVIRIHLQDTLNPRKFDFIYMGAQYDQKRIVTTKDFSKNVTYLKKAQEREVVMLAVCGAFEMFGNYMEDDKGQKLEGAGLLDIHTIEGQSRFAGNVRAKLLTAGGQKQMLVGFENHTNLTYLGQNAKPLAKVVVGKGNNGKDKTEGAFYKNTFGTNLLGPILPKNPYFCDYLIKLAIEKKYNEAFELPELDDEIEEYAHQDGIKAKY